MTHVAALRGWLAAFAEAVEQQAEALTDLDRRIGDGDHGANLLRGTRAVVALPVDGTEDASAYLRRAAMSLVSSVGGASGPLYGTFLLRFAGALPGPDATAHDWSDAWVAGADGVRSRGRATVGDKTMLDALAPAAAAFRPGEPRPWPAAAAAARAGSEATRELVARRGRAAYLGERSRGTVDPGSASAALLVEAAALTLGT